MERESDMYVIDQKIESHSILKRTGKQTNVMGVNVRKAK
jgi:hypothetical protein